MSERLATQTILLTGASSGIGAATAKLLLDRGATVHGVSRRRDRLPEGVEPLVADLTSRDDIESMFAQLGQIDGLVNAAGRAYLARVMDGDPAEWDEMWQVNVRALALCSQLAIPHFPQSGGRIVNVSSMSGHRVPPTGGFYAPTKFAVRAITDALRSEVKGAGLPVQVGSISPGFVETPLLNDYFREREDDLKQMQQSMRMLQPEDVASCIATMLEAPAHVEIGDILLRSADQKV